MPKIAVLTSGGDSPGMNTAVFSIARSANMFGMSVLGIKNGYKGLLNNSENPEDDYSQLSLDTVLDIADQPGTYLRTARCNEFLDPAYREQAAQKLRDLDVVGLVVLGGDGSFQGAMRLCDLGIPCIGIPATIDNDLGYTELTLGFDSAANHCMNVIRSIRATSRSHSRPHVVEVMGRHCGNLAMAAAASTGAEIVVVPEIPWSVQDVAARVTKELNRGNMRCTVVVAEGAFDSMEPFDVYNYLKDYTDEVYPTMKMNTQNLTLVLRNMCHAGFRHTIIGYSQRGVAPTMRDSVFALEAGHMAVRLLHEGKSNEVIGIREARVFHMPIHEALDTKQIFSTRLYKIVNKFYTVDQ